MLNSVIASDYFDYKMLWMKSEKQRNLILQRLHCQKMDCIVRSLNGNMLPAISTTAIE